MTPSDYWQSSQGTPWQRYLDREHAARDMYLEVTSRASREYLTGPWPDRPAYEVVERQAWATYYAAGRDAWRTYTREAAPPPPPPPPHSPPPLITTDVNSVTERIAWIERQPSFTGREGTDGQWPSS